MLSRYREILILAPSLPSHSQFGTSHIQGGLLRGAGLSKVASASLLGTVTTSSPPSRHLHLSPPGQPVPLAPA